MTSLCCPATKAYRDRPNQSHEDKYLAFLDVYPDVSSEIGSGMNDPNAFVIQLMKSQTKDNQSETNKYIFYCYYGDKTSSPTLSSQPKPKSPSSASGSIEGRGQPYRPPINTTQGESTRRSSYTYGSGWTRSSGSSGPPSRNSGFGPSNYTQSLNSTSNMNSRRTFGPPTWVSQDVADSKSSWRNNARPPSSTSMSTNSTGSRNASGRMHGSFGFGRGGDGVRRSPTSPRTPSVVSQSHSYTDRDTSGWETASNATNSTLQNRFLVLRDGASMIDDEETSDDDSSALDMEKIVDSVISPDDDDYFPPLSAGKERELRDRGLKVAEITEGQLKKLRMVRDGSSKMFKCSVHDNLFELHVYVPEVAVS